MVIGCIVEYAGRTDLTWSQRENDCRVRLQRDSSLCLKCINESGSCWELTYDISMLAGGINCVLCSGNKSDKGHIRNGLVVDASYLRDGIESTCSR